MELKPSQPSSTCGATEQTNHWRHIFLDCATAKMTWAAVYQGVMARTEMRITMTKPVILILYFTLNSQY